MSSKKITLSAMFIALGIVLPFITMNIPTLGNMLLPMHIPVLLGGFILGPIYGMFIGFVTPLLRSLMFGAPIFYPNAIVMSFELLTYGLISGVFYHIIFNRRSKLINIYISLILAMIFGRIIYGIVYLIVSFISLNEFTFNIFIMEAFVNAIPGIIIQLILIPIIIKLLGGYKYVK
jgi:predicted membrane protein